MSRVEVIGLTEGSRRRVDVLLGLLALHSDFVYKPETMHAKFVQTVIENGVKASKEVANEYEK